jgi:hypothetical protein
MAKKKVKRTCEQDDWDKDAPCTRVAKYECIMCGSGYCQKHYDDNIGECADCDPSLMRI